MKIGLEFWDAKFAILTTIQISMVDDVIFASKLRRVVFPISRIAGSSAACFQVVNIWNIPTGSR